MMASGLRALLQGPLFSRALRPFYQGRGAILALHRVVPMEALSAFHSNRGLELTPAHLKAVIAWARSLGYSFVSLSSFCEHLEDHRGAKMLCVTFDDGYTDNLRYALPILEAFDV